MIPLILSAASLVASICFLIARYWITALAFYIVAQLFAWVYGSSVRLYKSKFEVVLQYSCGYLLLPMQLSIQILGAFYVLILIIWHAFVWGPFFLVAYYLGFPREPLKETGGPWDNTFIHAGRMLQEHGNPVPLLRLTWLAIVFSVLIGGVTYAAYWFLMWILR